MLTFSDKKSSSCSGIKGCKVSMVTFGDRKSPSWLQWLQGEYVKSPGCRD